MTQFEKKSFMVPMDSGPSDKQRLARDGYEYNEQGKFWVKSSNLHKLGIQQRCDLCGKLGSNFDASTLDDWGLCKECYVTTIEDKEKRRLFHAMEIIDDNFDDEKVLYAKKFMCSRGMKRWIKTHVNELTTEECVEITKIFNNNNNKPGA
jgi:hypothetical protein